MTRSRIAAALLASGLVAAPGFAAPARDRVQVDVSKLRGTQSETTITVDPTNPAVLLAGSNNHRTLHATAYSSTNGGASWTGAHLPRPAGSEVSGDPVVAIDRTGRQYFGVVAAFRGSSGGRYELHVASRPNAAAAWTLPPKPVESAAGMFDDKPALAVDDSADSPHANRLYVAWSRITIVAGGGIGAIYLAHSDDTGSTWSAPAQVSDNLRTFDSYPTIDVARDGTVYVAYWNALGRGIYLDVSHDGGDTFGHDLRVDPIRGRSTCRPAGISIPAQPANCVRPNPILTVDNSSGTFAGRVYVTYGDTERRRSQDVFVSTFDGSLRPLLRRHRLTPPDGRVRSDQFWPAPAVDASTGVAWACFYDTRSDRHRRRAWYSCTRSRDGGIHWARPVHAATIPSNERAPGADSINGGLRREYGDYEGLAAAGGVAHPIWTDTRRLRTLREEVFTTTLSDASFAH